MLSSPPVPVGFGMAVTIPVAGSVSVMRMVRVADPLAVGSPVACTTV